MTLSLIDHLYVIAISAVLLFVMLKQQPQIKNRRFTTQEKIGMYWGNSLFLYGIAAIAVLIWWWQGRGLDDMGFRLPGENVGWYLGLTLAFVVWVVTDATWKWMSPRKRKEACEQWRRLTPFMPENRAEMPHAMQLAVCAGITEEIVFRGFLIGYFLLLLTGSLPQDVAQPFASWQVWLAVAIPAVIFGLSHLYQGWSGVAKVIFLSIMFGAIFIASGSLLVVVVLHILIDVFAALISPGIMAVTAEQTGKKMSADSTSVVG